MLVKGSRYRYHLPCVMNEEMVEYHFDAIPDGEFKTEALHQFKFGGVLSARMFPVETPMISFGHEEAIFRQYIHT
jgi:hypothetical protein